MKALYRLFVLLTFFSNGLFAQSPTWKWAKGIASTLVPQNRENGKSVTSDANGNCYVTGDFSGPNIVFGKDTLVGAGFFITKYDSLGNVLWSKGGNGGTGNSICTDAFGDIYVTGQFASSIQFDSIQLTGRRQLFIVKYNSSGKVLWATTAGSKMPGINTDNQGNSITTDGRGDVFVTGFYQNAISFDTITLTDTLGHKGGLDGTFFIVKYSRLGTALWAKTSRSERENPGNGITADVSGNSYVTGTFLHQISFGNITLKATAYNKSAFIVKYDQNGNEAWAKCSGDYPSSGNGKSVSLDANNNLYVTGSFDTPLLILDKDTVTNAAKDFGWADIFIAKISPAGEVLWLKSTGSELYDESANISTDKEGNSYVTGYFMAAMNLDKIHIYSAGGRDGFIAKYNTNGTAVWAKTIGETATEYNNGICVSPNGHVYVTGTFISTFLEFGNIKIFNSDKWGNGNSQNMFVARLDGNGKIGINEKNKQQFLLTAYPNPFTASTTLKFSIPLKNATVTIYTSCGQKVKTADHFFGDSIRIEREQLAAGLYFYQLLADDNRIATGKLIITD